MATKKAVNIFWLLKHVATYTLILFVGVLFLLPLESAMSYAALNGLLHLATDYITSKAAKRYEHKPRIFYPILGFDQFLHLSALVWTWT